MSHVMGLVLGGGWDQELTVYISTCPGMKIFQGSCGMNGNRLLLCKVPDYPINFFANIGSYIKVESTPSAQLYRKKPVIYKSPNPAALHTFLSRTRRIWNVCVINITVTHKCQPQSWEQYLFKVHSAIQRCTGLRCLALKQAQHLGKQEEKESITTVCYHHHYC